MQNIDVNAPVSDSDNVSTIELIGRLREVQNEIRKQLEERKSSILYEIDTLRIDIAVLEEQIAKLNNERDKKISMVRDLESLVGEKPVRQKKPKTMTFSDEQEVEAYAEIGSRTFSVKRSGKYGRINAKNVLKRKLKDEGYDPDKIEIKFR